MATRYLTALDYSDWRANAVLKKIAKKRPLGDLESRYQYTPPQPVLSCRTVDIDVSGTRTYRPRSTIDILAEQQTLIHRLFRKGRTAASAPTRRSPRKGLGLVNEGDSQTRSKIHIQGRPCTSMSQTSEPSRLKSGSSGQRPKTTAGRLKNVKSATDSFMVLNVDEDMLETRRSHNELTNQIHAHWRPENSNLNQGHFMRGQKRPDDVPPTLDAWLTFGGVAGEESGGVVDAFASFQSPDDYYNIEGSVGSRVAQQLQKGDRIRIGINGEVLSHDLKVKKWVKGDQSPRENGHRETPGAAEEEAEGRRAEAREEQAPESAREKPSPATAESEEEEPFGDMTFQNLEDLVLNTEADAEGKENSDSNRRTKILSDFPLSWEDQVSRPEVKVISARPTPRDGNRENLCETHPVLYNRVVRHSQPRPKLASTAQAANGYRVKQRPLGNGSSGNSRADSSNHLADGSGSKVRAISFDHNSPEEEQRLSSMSVDDVIQMRLARSATSPFPGMPSSARARAKNGPAGGGGGGEEEEECNASASRARKAADQRLKDKPHQRSYSAVSKSSGRSQERAGKGQQSLSSSSSAASGRPLALVPRPSSSVPLRGSRDMDLSIVTPVASRSRLSERVSSGKGGRSQTTSKSVHYPRGLGGGVNSINAGPIPGDTEFIQISQPIRNPNSSFASMSSAGPARSLHSPYPINISNININNINNNNNNSAASTPLPRNSPLRSNTPEDGLADSEISPRTITPTTPAEGRVDPNKPSISQNGNGNGNGNEGQSHLNGRQNGPEPGPTPEPSLLNQSGGGGGGGGGGGSGGGGGGGSESAEDDGGRSAPASESAASLQSAPGARAISIPTGGHLQDDEDEEELTVAQRRERTLRDQQIDQITDLLVGAIVGGEQK